MNFKLLPIVSLCLILTIVSLTGCVSGSESEDWENKYETLKIENIVLKADMETAQADIAYLKSALEKSKDGYDTLKDDYSTLKATSRKLQADYNVIQTSYNALRTDYTTLKADYDSLEAGHITLKATFNQLQVDYDKLKADYDALKVLYEDAQNELSKYIKDLAYIKILAAVYSDDADPESDGISFHITFYDSKSKGIAFQNIPVTVTIELYARGYTKIGDYSFPDSKNRELVYRDKVIIDHSTGILSWAEIRIPFTVDQNRYSYWGDMEVTVTTPRQGDFHVMQGLRLYD